MAVSVLWAPPAASTTGSTASGWRIRTRAHGTSSGGCGTCCGVTACCCAAMRRRGNACSITGAWTARSRSRSSGPAAGPWVTTRPRRQRGGARLSGGRPDSESHAGQARAGHLRPGVLLRSARARARRPELRRRAGRLSRARWEGRRHDAGGALVLGPGPQAGVRRALAVGGARAVGPGPAAALVSLTVAQPPAAEAARRGRVRVRGGARPVIDIQGFAPTRLAVKPLTIEAAAARFYAGLVQLL